MNQEKTSVQTDKTDYHSPRLTYLGDVRALTATGSVQAYETGKTPSGNRAP